MSCVVKTDMVIKYVDDDMEIYYYVLDNVVDSEGRVFAKCVSSLGNLLNDDCYFIINKQLDDSYEKIPCNRIMDCCPKEGKLYLYRTEGEWKVLKYTMFSVGYCFDSLTTDAKYNLPGGTFVYSLSGLTEEMVTDPRYIEDYDYYESIEAKYDYDKLIKDYRNLVEEYEELSDKYDELLNNEAIADYVALNEQKVELEKEVEKLKDLVIKLTKELMEKR